jgi:hypothetical protein
MVLGLAATAMPFARTAEAEAERWLWVLRLHGESGVALQALGIGEAPLEGSHEGPADERVEQRKAFGRDVIAHVSSLATRLASERGADTVSTKDILVAVMDTYGDDFDRVLRAHGTDSQEVAERLAADEPAQTGR